MADRDDIDNAERDQDYEAIWDAEIAKRIADIESGRVKPMPWPEARRIIAGEKPRDPRT